MPIVQIELLEGRTTEQKRAIADKVTKAIMEAINCSADAISIIMRDMPRENYAKGGVLAADRK